jgi:hypothetical protein
MGINYSPNDSDDAFFLEFELRMEFTRHEREEHAIANESAVDKVNRLIIKRFTLTLDPTTMPIAIEIMDKEIYDAWKELEAEMEVDLEPESHSGGKAQANLNRVMRDEAEMELNPNGAGLAELDQDMADAEYWVDEAKDLDEFLEATEDLIDEPRAKPSKIEEESKNWKEFLAEQKARKEEKLYGRPDLCFMVAQWFKK